MLDSIDECILDSLDQDDTYLNALFDQARAMLEESYSWTIWETPRPTLTTRYKRFSSSSTLQPRITSTHIYIQRQSLHDDITYAQLCKVLRDPTNDAKCLARVLETKPLKQQLDKAGIYETRVQATLTLPREYVDLVATREDSDGFWKVTQPVNTDRGPKKNHVRAQHLAWDHVCEKSNKDGKWVEWTRIEQSCPGGWMPCLLSNWNCGQGLVRDVDDLVDYLVHY